jgi:hypothetical protein
MLRIDSLATIVQTETLLNRLEKMRPSEVQELVIANNLRLAHCGGVAALIQFIVTWARAASASGPILRAYDARDKHAALSNLVGTLPGLVAVLMARDVQRHGTGESLLQDCYELARERVERMDEGPLNSTKKGVGIELLCADETSKRALQPFYHRAKDGRGELRGEEEFIDLARSVLDASVGFSRRSEMTKEDEKALGIMLRELFTNTHIHARNDEKGRRYRKSVRGIFAAHHLMNEKTAHDISGGYKPLADYFSTMIERSQQTKLQLFELSVFDSGPGFAARLAGKVFEQQDSIKEEYEFVKRCFFRNVSTRTAVGGGIGLPRMLQRLKAHRGFLRLRTGRLSLYKAFGDVETDELENSDFDLADASNGADGVSRHAPTSGTVLTLLIPLGRK